MLAVLGCWAGVSPLVAAGLGWFIRSRADRDAGAGHLPSFRD